MKKFKNLLKEAFSFKPIDYGIDFVDKKWQESKNGSYTTNFIHEDKEIKIIFHKNSGSFIFGVNNNINPSNKTISFKNMLAFYNKINYIILQIFEKFNVVSLHFVGSEPELSKIYTNMFNNNSYIKLFNTNGVELNISYNQGDKIFIMTKIN